MSVPICGVVVIGDDELETPVCAEETRPGWATRRSTTSASVWVAHSGRFRIALSSLVSVVVAERGSLHVPPPGVVELLAVGPDCVDVVDITRSVATNLSAVAAAKGIRRADVEVAVLDRSRQDLVNEVRKAGARVRVRREARSPGDRSSPARQLGGRAVGHRRREGVGHRRCRRVLPGRVISNPSAVRRRRGGPSH
ncbi:fructose-bisphosphatase class II [Pseudonocardia benzenivorans]